MIKMKQIIIFKLLLLLHYFFSCHCYLRVCIYNKKASLRYGNWNYCPQRNYLTGMCSHIIYVASRIAISPTTGMYGIEADYDDMKECGYEGMYTLKQKDKHLKNLLAVTSSGFTQTGSSGFTEMVSTRESRKAFIDSSIKFLLTHKFDGISIHWLYPGHYGSPPEDKFRFTLFCQELKYAYEPYNLWVTALVAGDQYIAKRAYNIKEISKSLDLIHLMSFALLASPFKTNHHTDANFHLPWTDLSVVNSVGFWLANGAINSKVMLGLAAFGHGWHLKSQCDAWLGAPATGTAGVFPYNKLCRMQVDRKMCTYSSTAKAPFVTDMTTWISYDDEESIIYKVNHILKASGLGGFMFWALDMDDFNNQCKRCGTYPLLFAAINALQESKVTDAVCPCRVIKCFKCCKPQTYPTQPPQTTQTSTTTTTITTTTPLPTTTTTKPTTTTTTPTTTTPTTTTTTTTPATISPCTTTIPTTIATLVTITTTCVLPVWDWRYNCWVNPYGYLSTRNKIAEKYCRTRCPTDENCRSDMCCCDTKTPTPKREFLLVV